MADVQRIIERIRANGANVAMESGRLRVVNGDKLPEGALAFVEKHKAEIAAALELEAAGEGQSTAATVATWLTRDRANELSKLLMANNPGDPDWTWFVGEAMKVMDEVAG